jgi:hypothetical protein
MNDPDAAISPITRKLLAFTDNRQDAALQAGHFNDFLFVTLLRGAILAALAEAGNDGLYEDQIGQAIQRMLGFVAANVPRRAEWLVEPDLMGPNLLGADPRYATDFLPRTDGAGCSPGGGGRLRFMVALAAPLPGTTYAGARWGTLVYVEKVRSQFLSLRQPV